MQISLFLNLVIAHIVSDFYLQWNAQCENKRNCGFNGYGLWYHTIIVGITAWAATLAWEGWWLAVIIMISHCLIDWTKSYFSRTHEGKKWELCLFVMDQLMHVGVIYGIMMLWTLANPSWQQAVWLSQLQSEHPMMMYTAIALLVALKPANVLILSILNACKVNTSLDENEHGNFHSGELIGWVERGLMLVFVVLGEYEAIGFLIAGKSILRFGEASKGDEKSEYVLCGTLLSLSVALILGLLVKCVL